MRTLNISIFFYILLFIFTSCQQQEESFLDLKSSERTFVVGESYTLGISSSENVTAVTIQFGAEDAIYADGATFTFMTQEVKESERVILRGHDSAGNLLMESHYDFTYVDQMDAPPVEPEPQPEPDPVYPPNDSEFPHHNPVSLPGLNTLYRPWTNSQTAIVIDAYQGNSIDWDKMAADKRMAAVIHRSGDGLRRDTKYLERRAIAKERGYLWGAYHLGRPGNVIEQADMFLDMVGDDDETLLVLDLENTQSSSMMDTREAIQFVEYVYQQTGKIVVIYANHSTTLDLNKRAASHHLLKRAPFWYARFRSEIPSFPTGIWDTYFLWQFSSEINCRRTGSCLYNVPGTTFYMDINVFPGTVSELQSLWYNPGEQVSRSLASE
jgi:lysozyme